MQRKAKKPKAPPKNLEWGGVDKFIRTVGRGATVPPEFEATDLRIKEWHNLLMEIVKQAKRYSKSLAGCNDSAIAFAGGLQEFAQTQAPQTDQLLARTFQKLNDTQLAAETSHGAFKEKIETVWSAQADDYIQDSILPGREAKRVWQKTLVDYEAAKTKLEEFLKNFRAAKPENLEPIKLFITQSHLQLARLKEQERFEVAADGLGDTLWTRDTRLLLLTTELMMEFHDSALNAYSHFFELSKSTPQLRKDVQDRIANLNDKRAKIQQERLKQDQEIHEQRYDGLVALLSDTNTDLPLMNALCVTAGTEQEQLLKSIIKVLDAHKRTLPIIKLTISTEVAQTSNAHTLFRGNSVATKLMTSFTKMTGRKYLREVQNLVQNVISNYKGFEVDPNKAKDQDTQENMIKLKSTCQAFVDCILGSLDRCPLPFREMANHLHSEVAKKFPGSKSIAVAGFIFLRFFCPAILSPDTAGLVEGEIPPDARRPLILISKSIQNLANGQKFGVKEEFMSDMNIFIDSNTDKVTAFLEAIATVPSYSDYDPLCNLEDAKSLELPKIHTFIVKNLDKIGKALYNYKHESIIDHLVMVLGELGDLEIEVGLGEKKKKKGIFGQTLNKES